MKRLSITSALTVAGVLAAGSAAALVNTRVLDSSEGQTVQANRVQLVEAQVWEGPPMASPQLPTTIADPYGRLPGGPAVVVLGQLDDRAVGDSGLGLLDRAERVETGAGRRPLRLRSGARRLRGRGHG